MNYYSDFGNILRRHNNLDLLDHLANICLIFPEFRRFPKGLSVSLLVNSISKDITLLILHEMKIRNMVNNCQWTAFVFCFSLLPFNALNLLLFPPPPCPFHLQFRSL